MSLMPKAELLVAFDAIRSSFLAAIDQIVAELRPRLATPGFYDSSLIGCAIAFSDTGMVREQLNRLDPELIASLPDDEIEDTHIVTIAYLFSLVLHELMSRPDPRTALLPEEPKDD